MIGYEFTITNRNGDSFSINDFSSIPPANGIALQDYPVFDVDVKNSELDREGQHGIWDFFSFYGKRVITLTGVIFGTTEAQVETLRKQMLKVLTLSPIPTAANDGYCDVEWTDANGDAWQIEAKMQDYPRFDRSMKQKLRLKFILSLKAKDPEIESQDAIVTDGLRGWQTGDFGLPVILPSEFDLVYDNEMVITNGGTVQAHTVIRLSGEAGGITNPRIINGTTGAVFKVITTLADDTKWVEIDSKTGTVVDQDGNDLSADIDGASEYILLNVGDNSLVYLSDESEGASSPLTTWVYPTAAARVSFHNTII